MIPVLNLNNEVVKMRKDVKKVKVLTIRRLTRHISKLKSKKGTEELILKNQRRAERLLEEIHTIKKLKPDDVTKTALRKEINFEEEFKKANSTAETRAIARLATQPLLKQKISAIKDAVKAFKDARKNLAEEEGETEQTSKTSEPTQNVNTEVVKKCKQEKAKPKQKAEQTKPETETLDKTACKRLLKEPDFIASSPSHGVVDVCSQKTVEVQPPQAVPEAKTDHKTIESIPEKKPIEDGGEKKTIEIISERKVASVLEAGTDSSSDIEDSDKEDKEYFDDSTEERFYKKPSDFEDSESDSEDDFFIGKVRRTKKKKSNKKFSDVKMKKDKLPAETTGPTTSGSEEKKGNFAHKKVKLESVFCKSLSETKRKSSYTKRENKLPLVRNKKSVVPQAHKLLRNPQPVRGAAVRQPSKRQDQALHPSWEASRKRKEQSQIAVFQGKKIVFDD